MGPRNGVGPAARGPAGARAHPVVVDPQCDRSLGASALTLQVTCFALHTAPTALLNITAHTELLRFLVQSSWRCGHGSAGLRWAS